MPGFNLFTEGNSISNQEQMDELKNEGLDTTQMQEKFNNEQKRYDVKSLLVQSQDDFEIDPMKNLVQKSNAKVKLSNEEANTDFSNYETVLEPGEWEKLNTYIAHVAETQDIDAATEEAYKMATAIEFSRHYNISPAEALDMMEPQLEADFGKQSYTSWWKAVKDSWTLGTNVVELSKLGKDLEYFERAGDTESANQVYEKIKKLEEWNDTLQDGVPRNIFVKALKAGAETIPYSAAVGIPSLLMGVLLPELAPAVGFAVGTDLTRGSEYYELRKAGFDPEVANNTAALSSMSQALIEQSLGTLANTTSSALAVMGKKALKNVVLEEGLEAVTDALYKKVFSGLAMSERGFKAVARGLVEYGQNALEEGLEEALQEFTSAAFYNIAAYCDDNNIDARGFSEVWDSAVEQAKGAILGSLILGVGDASFSAMATARDFQAVKDYAITAQSREAFVKDMQRVAESGSESEKSFKGAKVFEGMSSEEIQKTAGDIYDNYSTQRAKAQDEVVARRTQEIQEGLAAGEGIEEVIENENGEREVIKEDRNEDGSLVTSNSLETADSSEGNRNGTFKAGNNSQESNNVYGYINYTVNDKNNSVTIDAFKMTSQREYLRQELFSDFAKYFAGYDIKWDAKLTRAQNIKESLIENNPSGKKNGLNYFEDAYTAEELKARSSVASEIAKNIPNMSREEIDVSVAFFEAMAKRQGMGIQDFYKDYFDNKLFGTDANLEAGGHAGGVEFYKNLQNQTRAVIYAAKNTSDVSTFLHEMTHVYRRFFLAGEDLAAVEKTLGVVDGNWTRENEETFAEGLEQALKDGKVNQSFLKDIYNAIAEFIARVWHYMQDQRVDLNDDLIKAYNNMLAGDEGLLALADKALMNEVKKEVNTNENTGTFKAGEKVDAVTPAENNTATEITSNETDTTEELKAQNEEIIDSDKVMNDKTQDALEVSGEIKAEIEDATQKYELYQMLGTRVASLNPRARRTLETADRMLKEGRTSREIRQQTNWTVFNGSLWYEVDDNELQYTEAAEKLFTKLVKNKEIVNKRGAVKCGTLNAVLRDTSSMIFDSYPQLKDVELYVINTADQSPAFDVKSGNTEAIFINVHYMESTRGMSGLKGALIRGLQLAINRAEGLAETLDDIDNELLVANLIALSQAGGKVPAAQTMGAVRDIYNLTTRQRQSASMELARRAQIRTAYTVAERMGTELDDLSWSQRKSQARAIAENTCVLYQVIGENGARSLDQIEESTTRLDNLTVAREMEKAGKDAKIIRLATGWEKGADGKWRYEINDGTIFKNQGLVKERGSDIYAHGYLENILDNEELFNAYPELKKIQIMGMSDNAKEEGSYSASDKTIRIKEKYIESLYDFNEREQKRYENLVNKLNDTQDSEEFTRLYKEVKDMQDLQNRFWTVKDNAKTILLHEVQHAIQELEGFAKGGSLNSIAANYYNNLINDLAPIYAEIGSDENLKNKITEYKKQSLELDYDSDDFIEQANKVEAIKNNDATLSRLWDELQNISRKYNLENNMDTWSLFDFSVTDIDTGNAREALRVAKNTFDSRAYYDYKALAGEVESRNVESRLNMSDQERLDNLLAETEDVSREDQIILFQPVSQTFLQVKNFNSFKNIYPNVETDTPNFKQWFNGSKVTDENGKPLVVYHGTKLGLFDKKFTEFNTTSPAWFSTTKEYADNYTRERNLLEKPALYSVYLNIKNPLNVGYIDFGGTYTLNELSKTTGISLDELKAQNFENTSYIWNVTNDPKFMNLAQSKGYDGLIAEEANGVKTYAVFSPTQIKSVNNNGNFDVENPNILYQTQAEMMSEAAGFDSWQEWMEYVEATTGWFEDDASQIPSGADAAWYQNTWEIARGISPTTQEQLAANNQAELERDKYAEEDPAVLDAMFTTALKNDKGMLEKFLSKIQEIKEEEYIRNPYDRSEVEENENLQRLKERVSLIKHGRIVSNANGVYHGSELSESSRKQITTLMSQSARDYRSLYADLFNVDEWKVSEEENQKINEELNEGIKKYELSEISGAKDILKASAEERSRIAGIIENEKIRDAVKSGSLKAGTDLDKFVEYMEAQVKDAERKVTDAEDELQSILNGIHDAQQRELLKKYDELIIARGKYNNKSDKTAKTADAAIQTADRYKTGVYRSEKATYETVYRQMKDLEKVVEVTADMKRAIALKENIATYKEDAKEKKQQQEAYADLKKLRKQLVKTAMRKVNFAKVDYNHAVALIAVQRVFEPNLLGGVNRWIGTEGAYPRNVWSAWNTDTEYREKTRKLLVNSRSKKANEIINLLDNTKTLEQFDTWTKKQRDTLIRLIPKENWIKELKLDALKDYNEDIVQLKIDEKTQDRKWTDENGNVHYETITTPVMDKDVEEMVRNVLGADLFDLVVNRAFADWTTEDMERFARRMDQFYQDGMEALSAKKEAEKEIAQEYRNRIIKAVKNTGIVINPGDSDEVKKTKLKKINKILGLTNEIKGTAASKFERQGFFASIFKGYGDMNVRRFTRMIDDYQEGVNTELLYWNENDCYTAQERAKEDRISKVNEAMKNAGVTLEELQHTVTLKDFGVQGRDVTFSVDELLYYYMAEKDEMSKEAVMYGSMIDVKDRDIYKEMDADYSAAESQRIDELNAAIASGDKAREEELRKTEAMPEDEDGRIIPPGTMAYRELCETLFERVLNEAAGLDKKFFDFAEAIADDYSTNIDRLQKMSIEEFNAPIWRVENYVPLVRLDLSGDTNEAQVKADMLAQTGTESAGNSYVGKGFTQKRVKISPLNQAPVEAGLYKTWADSVERTEHFLAYAPYVRLLNRVYGSRESKSMKQWIESRYGRGAVNYIDNTIKEAANPEAGGKKDALSNIVRALRGKTAPAYLSWKLSSVLKQAVTSPMPFMQYISPAKYLSAIFDMIKNPKVFGEAISAKSVFMKNRRFDPLADIIADEVKKNNSSKLAYAWAKFQETGMQGLEWIDYVCVAPGWYALYKDKKAELENKFNEIYERKLSELKENTDPAQYKSEDELELEATKFAAAETGINDIEEDAVRIADDLVRMSQPSNRKIDLSPIFKDSNEVTKALLQFTTSLNVIWQNVRYDLPYAMKQKEFKQVVGMIAGYTVAGVMLGALAGDFTGDDEPEDKIKSFIFDATTQFTDGIPVIGSIITNLDQRLITGKSTYQNGTDLFPELTKFIQGTQALSSGSWDKACKRYAEGVGMFLGAPVSGTKELLYAIGIDDGEEGLDFKPEAFLGQRN